MDGLKTKRLHMQKNLTKMVNARNIAGNAEQEEEEEYVQKFPRNYQLAVITFTALVKKLRRR